MNNANEALAATFLTEVARHQDKLIRYACSLAKCPEAGHDLYAETLLKCRDRIAAHGFYGESFIPYVITAIKCNFYYQRREAVQVVSLSEVFSQAEEAGDDEALARDMLATGIRSFVSAHFKPEEVAAFDLHVHHGMTLQEVSFVTDYANKMQVWYAVQRIKETVRENFKL